MANMYPSELGGGGAGGTPPATKGYSIEGQNFGDSSNTIAAGSSTSTYLVNIDGCTSLYLNSKPSAVTLRYCVIFEDGTQGNIQTPTAGGTYTLPSNGKWLCLTAQSSSGGYSIVVTVS